LRGHIRYLREKGVLKSSLADCGRPHGYGLNKHERKAFTQAASFPLAVSTRKFTSANRTRTRKGRKQLGAEVLKERFLQCIGLRFVSATALHEAIKGLIEMGISRKTLVAWAVQGGCSKGYASTLLSRIFSALGMRERRAGAGRKPSPDTLELLALSHARYGARSVKVLRSAWRVGKAQMAAGTGHFAPQPGTAPDLSVASPLRRLGTNYGPVINRNGKPAAWAMSVSASPVDSSRKDPI
jgi:hypothetical protein